MASKLAAALSVFEDIRCVVFDLDDTLWPCEPTIVKAEEALYNWLQENYSRLTDCYSYEDLNQYRASYALQNPHIAHDMTALRKESLKKLAQQFAYPSALAIDGLALFRRHRNMVNLFDDALPTINSLNKHFILGVITNGNADLEAIGLSENFEFIVSPEEAGVAKPNTLIFEYARKKVNLACHELLYVGDHPAIDVLGAINSNWKSIWFNPTGEVWHEEIKPHAQIQALSELPNLLSI